MKILLVLASFLVLSSALDKETKEKFMEKMHEIATKCIAEVHATDDDVGEIVARKIPPTSHEGKCLIFCIHRGFKMVTEDAKVDREGTLASLEMIKDADADLYEKFVKLMDICSEKVKPDSDPCVTSTNYAECGIKEAKAMGMTEDLFDI